MRNSTELIDPLLLLTIRLGRIVMGRMYDKLNKEDQHLMGPHLGVLSDLYQKDGVRQQDLAISSFKDKATITRSLKLLEREELVLRTADPIDKRTKRIYITPKGRKVYQAILPLGQETIAEAKAGIAEEELKTCESVLQKMYNNLSK
ncbi:MarR family winged helix-turn-helix transcriptional regulator [Lewinella sp. LCG006]|uniref:MarR family winged helix-turn-helix transcriptional regulator n=1 Tax=Lewinella sp. LCG006 TaxID=3231911 RepID=UPI00345F67C7